MSSITPFEADDFETLLDMGGGYVLSFSNRTFADFVSKVTGINIEDSKYTVIGTSKANRLRAFWNQESDSLTAKLLSHLIEYALRDTTKWTDRRHQSLPRCRRCIARLQTNSETIEFLHKEVDLRNEMQLKTAIERMVSSIESDPSLAIGSAKDLIESCCKTVLRENNAAIPSNISMKELVSLTLRHVSLIPDGVERSEKGAAYVEELLGSLAALVTSTSRLRNSYGTGHGREASEIPLTPRHARLVVNAASAFVAFVLSGRRPG